MPLKEDVAAALGGDKAALDTKSKKGKKRSPAEVVAGLTSAQRSTLRARAEEIIEAIDAYESENGPEDEEEEEV